MKTSAVMVMPTVSFDKLPVSYMQNVRHFLFHVMRGLDDDHDRRWKRNWARVARGELMQFYPAVERSGAFHKRHMTIEGRVFAHQDHYPPTKAGQRAFRNWLKVGASLVTLELHDGDPKWLPGSVSYEDLSDDEFREFHEAAMDFLHTPRALRRLWPDVKTEQRLAMLQTVINNPEETE